MAPLQILIVDDHEFIRQYIYSQLSSRIDWSICGQAADGIEAVEKAKELRPDIIIMDISMPRMDGVEASRIIQQEIPQSDVILISQNDPAILRQQAAAIGARAYLSKVDLGRDLVSLVSSISAARNGDGTHVEPNLMPESSFRESERRLREMIDVLPFAIYTTDAQGRLTHFNPAAVKFSGRVPELGTDKWCISWKIFAPDGTPVPHDQCPMATALKEGRIVEGGEFIAERPDGTRVWFTPYPRPLRDVEGKVIAGVNLLMDITERKQAEQTKNLLAAIVDSSDDAIVSKSLEGIITSWNRSAERLFGYTAKEAVGQPITLIVPRDRLQEEKNILERLKRGQRVDHFETVRVRKDRTTLDISLTISPVNDAAGRVVGASKVARDVTERKQTEQALAAAAKQQKALFHFADQLHRATSLDDVYAATLNAIFAALRCDRASILLYDEFGVMRFVSWHGLSDGYRKATEGHSPWKSDERRPEPICMSDVDTKALEEPLKAIVKAEGINALAFIPLVSQGKLIGKFMMYFDEPHIFSTDELELSLTISRQLSFGIERRRAEEALRQSEERFRKLAKTLDTEVRLRTAELEQQNTYVVRQSEQGRDLSRRLMQIRDDERRRIARELHDSVGQTIAALGINLARISQEPKQSIPEFSKVLVDSQELVQQLNQEIRTMSYLLHPPLLDESGLVAAVSWYVQGLAERSGLDIKLNIPEDFGRLSRDMELVVFRIVQECLTNIHRHSGSKNAIIQIAREPENITIAIQDEGKGIPPQRLGDIQTQGFGVGIRGMRERVGQFHGKMNIESNAAGTRISVVLPTPVDDSLVEQDRIPLQAAS